MNKHTNVLSTLKGISHSQKLLTMLDNRIVFLSSVDNIDGETLDKTIKARETLNELIEDYATIVSSFTISDALEVMTVEEFCEDQMFALTSVKSTARILEYRAYHDPDSRNRYLTQSILNAIMQKYQSVKDALIIH